MVSERQIDLVWLSDSDEDSKNGRDENEPPSKSNTRIRDSDKRKTNALSAYERIKSGTKITPTKTRKQQPKTTTSRGLQAGLVLEEDIFAAVSNDEKSKRKGNDTSLRKKAPPNVLFEDPEFGPVASSIQGCHRLSISDANTGNAAAVVANPSSNGKENSKKWRPKCRCNLPAELCYRVKDGRPYFCCGKNASFNRAVVESKARNNNQKCKFFQWAFAAEFRPWYRFGPHNGHILVQKQNHPRHSRTSETNSRFSAQDLVQGKVGDCWFLSALAVVAERSDLIERLFRKRPDLRDREYDDEKRGIVRINLFLDGIWTPLTIDNFLPCSLANENISQQEDDALQKAIEASLLDSSDIINNNKEESIRNPYAKPKKQGIQDIPNTDFPPLASRNDPHGLSETNLRVMKAAADFVERDCRQRRRGNNFCYKPSVLPKGQRARTSDLAYSKARHDQLWVPFLEKAYAKIHGSYQAISGGHVAEAFLDLTGAPTLQVTWHADRASEAQSSSVYSDPKRLWEDLKKWRRQKLPMGCGTDRSAVGLIGMHAYSILDVIELTNVDVSIFRDRLIEGSLGNASGFTQFDGKLRLLRVRNPHGKGEWKGEFSDKCQKWERLLADCKKHNPNAQLPQRTMANDGTFWIGYDDFLLGFSNIDVVLAFEGNHAKSFVSNFPPKKSRHRCQRAFEVSLLDQQPGLAIQDTVEVYVMGIQKSRRGARQGRADRKKSYKVSDFGILVGECPLEEKSNGSYSNPISSGFSAVHGQMFGFTRNGHYKLVLDRNRCKRLVVMPISFGHPAATDEFRSFVVRFNANAPLMIRELEAVPRMDRVLGDFLVSPNSKPFGHLASTRQGQQSILWSDSNHKVVRIDCLGNGGGTVFVYLCAHPRNSSKTPATRTISSSSSHQQFSIEATCRGMSCRTEDGLLEHETTAKGKKFQASWRKFTAKFAIEQQFMEQSQSRLLMVLFQSGQDTEMGTIVCKSQTGYKVGSGSNGCEKNDAKSRIKSNTLANYWNTKDDDPMMDEGDDDYQERGVFHPINVDASAFERCGLASVSGVIGSHNLFHEESVDEALEKAIALSRVEQGVTGSTNAMESGASIEDTMLQEAINRSRRDDQQNAVAAVAAVAAPTTHPDVELEDVLRRSYQEAFTSRRGNKDCKIGEVLDLVNDEEGISRVSRSESNGTAMNPQMIDLTTAESIPIKSKNNSISSDTVIMDLTAAPMKRAPSKQTDREKTDPVFILIDSSDEEDECGSRAQTESSKRIEGAKIAGIGAVQCSRTKRDHNDSRERKRKLAAEAAMKRFKKRN